MNAQALAHSDHCSPCFLSPSFNDSRDTDGRVRVRSGSPISIRIKPLPSSLQRRMKRHAKFFTSVEECPIQCFDESTGLMRSSRWREHHKPLRIVNNHESVSSGVRLPLEVTIKISVRTRKQHLWHIALHSKTGISLLGKGYMFDCHRCSSGNMPFSSFPSDRLD